MEKDYDKDYNLWLDQKKRADRKKKLLPFGEGEVWWCQIGVNIGYEILARKPEFTRPVLILKIFSDSTFLGAPLSTKKNSKLYDWHIPIEINGEQSNILLEQIRVYDARRLVEDRNRGSIMGNLTLQEFADVKQKLKDMFRSKKQLRKNF